jgi:hypothetical protein
MLIMNESTGKRTRKHRRPAGEEKLVAVIGDLVGSRRLSPASRRTTQIQYLRLLTRLNRALHDGIRVNFEITLGDEFEGLLNTAGAAKVISEMLWTLEMEFKGPSVRIGVGLGRIDTVISEHASRSDGPAFHCAREAIASAKKQERLGGVFCGFGENNDTVLNGIARMLHEQRARWSRQQRRVAVELRRGETQAEAAVTMGLSPQAISKYAGAAAWKAYAEGELALRAALERAVDEIAGEAASQVSNSK